MPGVTPHSHSASAPASAAHAASAAKPASTSHAQHAAHSGAGGGASAGCGSGAGGFKAGNTCGRKDGAGGGNHSSGHLTDASPQVQQAYRAVRKSSSHDEAVSAAMRATPTEREALRQHNPRAVEHAELIANHSVTGGTVVLGHKVGIPSKPQAEEIKRLHKLDKSRKDSDPTLSADDKRKLVDSAATRIIQDRYGNKTSDQEGHRYLVHDRTTTDEDHGDHYNIYSDAELRSYSPRIAKHLGEKLKTGHATILRQFDSQGVEVAADHRRFERHLSPEYRLDKQSKHQQNASEYAEEVERAKTAPRAEFGTAHESERSKEHRSRREERDTERASRGDRKRERVRLRD